MSVTTDSIYNAAWAALGRAETAANYPANVQDSHSALGSAYWNLYNWLRIARGDATVQGSAVTTDQRAAALDANGNLLAGLRSQIAGWTSAIDAVYPPAATTAPPVVVTPPGTTPPPGTNAPFLGGILDGQIFGIPTKYLLIAGALYLFTKD